MTRLLAKVDELIAAGRLTEEVVVQAAAPIATTAMRMHAALPHDEVLRLMGSARVVICHGGPGTITEALALGRLPIVVPRDPRFGEHVDDHQMRFVRWLSARLPIRPLWSLDQLENEIARDSGMTGSRRTDSRRVVVSRLIELVEAG
jgi:UDP-N-acetylglucosamine transferase subunit ALG13